MSHIYTIWVQSVLFNNPEKNIKKSIDSIINSMRVYNREHNDSSVNLTFCYGDSSKEKKLSENFICNYNGIDNVKFIYNFFNANLGSAKGHNTLAKQCDCDYIMDLNPDVIVSPQFFRFMLEPFADNKVGIVEARQSPIEHQKEYSVKTLETDWATTACVLINFKAFKDVNGFDDISFFLYCDDVDFSFRLRLAGYKIIYQPLAVVFHAKRLSLTGNWMPPKSEIYYSAEGALMMAYKYNYMTKFEEIYAWIKTQTHLYGIIEKFENLKEKKLLPEQLDLDHKIAIFNGNFYCKNRFIL